MMINTAENPKTEKNTHTPPPQTLKYECSDGILREVSPKKQQLFLQKAKRAGIAVKLVSNPADKPEILPQDIDFSKGLGYAYNGQPSEETKIQISNQWQQKQIEQQDNETYGDIYQNITAKYPSYREEQSAITRRGLASNLRNVPILKDIPIINALPNLFANMLDSNLEGVLQRKDDYQREIDLRKQDRDVSAGRVSPEQIRQDKENHFASFVENYAQNHPELTAEDRKLKYDYLQSVWDLEELEFRKKHKIFSDIHPEKQINERLDNVQQRLNYFNQLQLEDIDKKIRQEVDKGTISNFTANKLTNVLYEQYEQFSRDKGRQAKTFGSYWADWWNKNGLANTASLGYGQVVNDYYNSRKLQKLPQSIQQQYNNLQSEYNNLFGLTTKETAMYNFAAGIDQTLQLMGDFALTSGAGSAANLAAKKVIINAAKQEGKKAISRVAANKAVEKLTPVLAQTATMSILMPQMYQSALDKAQQRSGNMAAMPKFADYFDSWSRQIFENTIELYGGSAVTKKLSQSKVFSQIKQPQFLKRLSNNYPAIKQINKAMGLNNVTEELLEEWESQLLGILAYNEGSVTDFLDPQQQALTLASVVLFQSPKAASSVSYNIKQNRKATQNLATLQDEELAQILKITMTIPDSQQRHQALSELSPQIELLSTTAEKQAAVSYILNKEQQYYTDAAQTADIREQARIKAMEIAQSFGFEHTYISPTTQEQQRDFVISMAVPKEREQNNDNNQVAQNPYSNILFITSSPTEQGLVYVRQQNAKTGAFEKAKLMSLKDIADNYDVQTNLAMPFIENEAERAAQIYEQQRQQQKEQAEFEQAELERQSREELKKYFDQQQKDFETEKEKTDREFENITNEQTSNENQTANTNESPQSQTGNEQSTNQPFQQGNQPLQQGSKVYLDNFNTALNAGQRPEQYTIKSIDNDNAIIADESGSEQMIEGLNRLTPIANNANAEQPAPETTSQTPNSEIDFDLLLDNNPDKYFELYKEKVGEENILEVLRSLYNNINDEIKRRKDKPKRTINSADLAKYYQEINLLKKRAKTLESLVSREKNRKINEKIEQQREQNQSVPSQKSDNPNDQNTPNNTQTFVPDWTEDNPADARKRGFRMVNGIRIYRQSFPPIETYTETSVEYTITEKPQPAKETIIELDTIQPSHTTSGKNPQFFLDEAQPKESRTDGDSIDGRNKALKNFDNNKITFGENAYIDSSPQIKEDTREAIQGNNRLLILKELYSNPHYKEKAENYKRFLIANAERFGMTTEQIKTMEKPVNVKALNISDDEAIRLGQFTSENLQTGGKNYLDVKRINIKLIKADKMADFITLVLYSESNDTSSISALLMNNYEEALKFLRDNVIISVGEYQTAMKRDNYDNTLKELRKILEYSIRGDNNSQQLDGALDGNEGISNNVYNAVLQTSYRIFGVPEQAQFRKDLQDSIVIFWELQRDNNFRKLSGQSEEGLKRVRVFTDEWSRQTNINDFNNVYVPQNKYSNLAFELAVKYKQYLSNTNEIKSMFNNIYDRLNGVLDFFDIDRQYTLAETAKAVFDIDYNGYEISQKNGLLTGNEIAQKKEPEKGIGAKLPLQIKPQQETEAISNQPELPQQPKPDTSLSKISANSNEQTEAEPVTEITKTSDYGSNNTLVTKDRYRELQERMKQKLNELHSGIDPEFFNIGVEMAMYHIESGTRKFASYAKRMIEDLGDGIRPYLKSFYEGLRYLPQMTQYRDELDSRDYVDSFDVDNFDKEQLTEPKLENNTEQAVMQTPQKEPVINTNDIKSETEQNLNKPEKENPLKPDSPQELFSQTGDLFSDFANATITEHPEKNTEITPTKEQTNSTEPTFTTEQVIEASLQPLAADKAKNRRNNHQDYSESVVPKGNAAKIKANIAAIELAYKLRDEGKSATEKEMKLLRQYTGWGGLSMVFRGENQHYERIRELLGEDDWEQARQSTATAFYTPPYITHSVWRMIEKLGFRGGSVLEPSAGIGNFFATMPQALADRSALTAVEIDNTSGLILQLLYPDADVEITGYQDKHISNNSQDLIVTNVPFGNYNVYDKYDKDLSKRFKNIHDYFIAKSVRKLKAGGLGIFITTSGTMDRSRDFRQWVISEGNADFIDAVRLNTDTFKQEAGTEVTSDIVIIRKRDADGKNPFAKDMLDCQTEREASYKEGEQYNKKTHRQEPVIKTASMFYNKYFHDNPNRLSGVMKFGFEGGNRLRPTEQRLEPTSDKALETAIETMISDLPDNIYVSAGSKTNNNKERQITSNDGTKEGGLTIIDGKPYRVEFNTAIETDWNTNKVGGRYTKTEVLRNYLKLKESINALLEAERENFPDTEIEEKRKYLNATYNFFTARYGTLNNNVKINFLKDDIDFYSIAAIENVSGHKSDDKGITISRSDIFFKRTLFPNTEPKAESLNDAINISKHIKGHLDLNYVSKLMDISLQEARAKILDERLGFINPQTDILEERRMYLSGNVREKLHLAKADNSSGKYNANIEELSRVIPVNIPLVQIKFQLGSTWIPTHIYNVFFKEMFDVDTGFRKTPSDKFFSRIRGKGNSKDMSMGLAAHLKSGSEIAMDCMNNIQTSIYKTDYVEGKSVRVLDKVATAEAQIKQSEINENFENWLKNREEYREELEDIYNDFANAIVNTKPDVSKIERFPNAGNEGKILHDHQKAAVLLSLERAVLLAHQVGTGKTLSLITTAMEMKRLGLAQKPMVVIQKATVGQFLAEIKSQYPTARVLAPQGKDLTAAQRQQLFAKIAYNDWDMIVVYHSYFDAIPDDPLRVAAYIEERIFEKQEMLDELESSDENNGAGFITRALKNDIKSLEAQRKAELQRYERENGVFDESKIIEENNTGQASPAPTITPAKSKGQTIKDEVKGELRRESYFERLLDRRTDRTMNFEDLGVDALLIDEAHSYKKLGFVTSLQNIKGIDTAASQKAQGMKLKSSYILEKHNGRNIVFATGTPISNTMAEMWTFMRYLLSKQQLVDLNINTFDAFVKNFGTVADSSEFSTDGRFKITSRFSSYSNIPELLQVWQSVAHTILSTEVKAVNDRIPKLESDKPIDIMLDKTPPLKEIMNAVIAKLEWFYSLKGKEKKANSHIPLVMYNLAAEAAIDVRLVNSEAEDHSESKTNKAVGYILEDLKQTDDYKGTVAVFADRYRNRDGNFNLFKDIKQKLIKAGIPENEIAIINDYNTDNKREELFEKVNAGNVRVVMGTTEKLGTGVNIQQRLHLLVALDAPTRPSDYEQRQGRMMRQGNMHKVWDKSVKILRLGVKQTLDVTGYQRLEIKDRFIKQIMKGDVNGLRTIEEEDEVNASNFNEMMATLSGSDKALKLSLAQNKLRKLSNQKQYHYQNDNFMRATVKKAKEVIENTDKIIEKFNEYKKQVREFSPHNSVTEITLNGQSAKTPNEMTALLSWVAKAIEERVDAERKKATLKDNKSVLKFEMQINGIRTIIAAEIQREFDIDTCKIRMRKYITFTSPDAKVTNPYSNTENSTHLFEGNTGANIMNLVKNIDRVLSFEDADKAILEQKEDYNKALRDVETFEPQIGLPFAKEKELKTLTNEVEILKGEAEQEIKELEKQLKEDNAQSADIENYITDAEQDMEAQAIEGAKEYNDLFIPIDREKFQSLINRLMLTGLAKKVVLDKKAMQEYLRNYFVKQSRLKGKQINDEDIENFLTLWHGTSAYFEKFCKDYFLSGEGAMAYGAGHYFTSRRGIAESYARRHKSASNYIPLSDLQSFTLSDIMFNDYPIKDVLNNTYWESKFLELDGTQYNAIDDFKTAINNLYYDSRYKPKNVRIKEFEKHRKQLLDAIDSGLVTSNKLKNPNNFLLKVKIHGDKTIADLNFLRWDKPITDKQKEVIGNQLNNLQYIRNYQIGEKINVEGLIAQKEEWTGYEIYQMLAALFESDVKTSKFLLSLGIDGIQYPTEYQTKGSHEGNFNYVVFDDNAIEIEGKIRLMQTSKGEIYGFVTKDSTIYLDPDRINANTPIHEFAHLWIRCIKTANPKLYRKGLNIITKSRYYKEVLHNSFYANLTEPQKLEEALAFAIGNKGEKVFDEQKDNITLYAQIKQWLNEFWQWIKRAFNMNGVENIENILLENFTDKAVAELLRGKALNKNENNTYNASQFQSVFEDFPTAEQREELWNIKQQAIENDTFMKASNGNPTNLNEKQWLQVRTKAFKEWFGDWENDPANASKVVDENGEPLVVYHGTKLNNKLNIFIVYHQGVFFTSYYTIAERYAYANRYSAKTQIISVFLNLRKPEFVKTSSSKAGGFAGADARFWERVERNEKKGYRGYHAKDKVRTDAQKRGKDGFILEDHSWNFGRGSRIEDVKQYAVFRPSQIKSATANTGTFSSDNDDIRFHQSLRSLDKTNKLSAMEGQELDKLLHPNKNSQLYDKIARKFFDQYRPLHTLMLQMQATGHPPKADFYNRAIAATSRATAQIELFNKTIAADFEKAANKIINNPFIKDKNIKPTLDMIDYYFMAKFMPVRTEQLTGIKKEEQDLFGIYLAGENGFAKFLSQKDWYDNTKEADNRDYSPQGYVRWFENNVDKTTLANLQSKKEAIIKFLLDYALEGGQISEIEYTEYLSNKDYMPLRGWQNKTDRMGKDNFFQWLPKKPAGRVSMPDNSIPYLMSIVHSTIIFSEMNRAKRDLGFAIIDNRKNEELSDIVGLIKEYEYYTKNDKGEYIKVPPTRTFPNDPDMIAASLEVNYIKENAQNRLLSHPQYENEHKQHLLTFWHSGEKHTIYVENKAITKPFLDNAFEMNYIVTSIAKTTKFFTSMMTSRNLSFVPTNFLRDVQTAFFNHESAKFNKDFLQELTGMGSFIKSLINQKPSEVLENKHYGENIKAVIKGVRDIGSLNHNDPVEALYLYWAGAGGRTGYVQSFKDMEDIAKHLQNKFKHRNIYQKAGRVAKAAVIDQLLLQKYVVAMAEVFENITRFAYFKAALKNGYSMEEAVYKSKDATANFDRKGDLSKYISPFIGFYNATMAGIYKNRGQLRGNKWRPALNITSIITIGFLNAFLNGLLDDDDDKRSAWKKSKNLHFGGINIAPFSYDILPYINIGEQISNIVLNKVTPTEASYNIFMGTIEVFPDQAGDILKYVFSYNKGLDKIVFCDFNQLYNVSQSFPTAIVPIIQLATNTNFLGGKIVYEPFSEGQRANTPRIAYRYNANNTSDLAEWLSHSFNSIFWGSNYNKEFGINKSGNKMRNTLNPADIEFLGLSYTSGLWRTTSGFWELAKWFKTDKNMRVSTNDIISKLPIAERFVNPANEVAYSYKQREYFQQKYNPIFEKEKTFTAMTTYTNPDKEKQTQTRRQGKDLLTKLYQSAEYKEAKRYKDLNAAKQINDKIKELSNASQRGKYNNAEIQKLGKEFSDMINNFNRQLNND